MADPVRIQVPLQLPLRWANAWLYPGPPATLVDCGVGTTEGYDALRQGLWDSGADANGMRIIITHGHVDHVGNAARLRREFGAQLFASAPEAEHVASFRRKADERYAGYTAALGLHGVPADEVARMRSRGEAMDLWSEDVPVQRLLGDGERLELGGTPATVHVTPGHTSGSIVIATEDNDLLTGDTLLQHITSNAIELEDSGKGRFAHYLRTLDGLRRFVGMRALPGHHEPFVVTDALLDGHLQRHRERSERIWARLDRPHSAWELVPSVFPRLAGDQAFLGVCEVVGHLHALELEGRVRVVQEAGVTGAAGASGVRRFVRS